MTGEIHFGKWKVEKQPHHREKARQGWAAGAKGAKQEAETAAGCGAR